MNGGKVSRMTAMVALMVAVLMFGTPAAFLGGMDADPVDVASAADGTRQFKIGVVDMTVSTLNPNTYTMVAEGMVIFPLYSYLLQWDSEGENVIGDLAYDWHISPDGLTWEFDLVETAYFVDPRTPTVRGPQVTSEDVEWSVLAIASDTSSGLNSYWPAGIIEDTWTDDSFHFGITISEPFVPMMDSVMGNPILPKYYWESQDFTNFDNDPPIGSGPLYYATDGLPDDGLARLARNEFWHGETSYGWQLHVDEFLMIRQDDGGTCWSAVVGGEVQLDLSSSFNVDAWCGPLEMQAIYEYAFDYEPNLDLAELQGNLPDDNVGWGVTHGGYLLVGASTETGYGEPYSTTQEWFHPLYVSDAEGSPEDGIMTGAGYDITVAIA